jgi:segregation and condensation protein B|tara:strand:+ start:68988 stop:69542 length:555 start_codon:yes stop_codon:yes gene_type:complete
MTLEAKIEALLFFKGEPVTVIDLSRILDTSEESVKQALSKLEQVFENRGVALMQKGGLVELRTAPQASKLIEAMQKEELTKDLGKAGTETLAIVLYKGPIARSEIEYIRGVNSQFILRNLMIRGMIERVHNPKDKRAFIYKPTFELLSFLGIKKVEELPEFNHVQKEIESFVNTTDNNERDTQQ